MSEKRRAEPLSPGERRKAIVTAVIPLLGEHGGWVTTRQLAEAAGVAEGTIFRVFPDKAAVIHEAIRHSMDPEPVVRALGEISPEAPLEAQLVEAGRILVERIERVITLVSVLRATPHTPSRHHTGDMPDYVVESNRAIDEALIPIFHRHRDRLAIEPAKAAAAFRGLIFASHHPATAGRGKLTVPEIAALLVHGVLRPIEEPVG